jgi:hypothetical protein
MAANCEADAAALREGMFERSEMVRTKAGAPAERKA